MCLSRPPSWGRLKFPTPSPPQSGNWQRTREADATVGRPTAPHPNIAVWSPGTTPWGQKARRSLLTPRPVHPGWTFVFRSCQCLTSGVLAQGGEKGGFKLGTGRNLFFGLAVPPPPPQTLGGQTAQRGRGVGRTTGHSPSCRGTERNPAAAQPPGQPGQAVSLLGGLAAGRGPGGHLGASREPRGRCWWWRSGWGQTRAQGTLGRR